MLLLSLQGKFFIVWNIQDRVARMINGSEGLSYCELMSRELYLITKIKIKWVTGAIVEVQINQNFDDSL